MKPVLIYLAILLVAVSIANECRSADEEQRLAVQRRMYDVAVMAQQQYGVPMEREPTVRFIDIDGPDLANADCLAWEITFDTAVMRDQFELVLDELVPHEYAHLVACYLRHDISGPDGDAHDLFWQAITLSLGGRKVT
jgi:hypothetical protein